jgi:hypothetical protein
MDATARLGLPFLSAGQAQKELLHNEALQAIDLLLGAAVEAPATAQPPQTPAVGTCYIVGSGAGGDWAGKDGCLAGYTSGGWRFTDPLQGVSVFVGSTGERAVYRDGAWEVGVERATQLVIGGEQVVGGRAAAIAPPSGGTVVDSEARAAIAAILDALSGHGLIAM